MTTSALRQGQQGFRRRAGTRGPVLTRRRFVVGSAAVLGVGALAGARFLAYLGDPRNELRRYTGAAFPARPLAGPGARVLLRNGRFVDVAQGRYFPEGTSLLMEGDSILALPGATGEPINVRADRTLDLGGRAVIPGLLNTHCHLQLVNPGIPTGAGALASSVALTNAYYEWQLARTLAESIARGITTVRDAWAEDLRVNLALRDRVARGEQPGPRIVQAILVSPVDGPFAPSERGTMEQAMWRAFGAGMVPYSSASSGVVTFPADADEQVIRDAVDRAIDERGAEAIKVYDQRERRFSAEQGASFLSDAQLDALVDRARARGVPVLMHHNAVESFRRGLRVGVQSLDHFPFDQPLADADVVALLDSDTLLTPTLWLTHAGSWSVPGHPSARHPNVRRLTAYRAATFADQLDAYWIPELRGQVRATYEAFGHPERNETIALSLGPYLAMPTVGVANVQRLWEAGVPLGTGNDSGGVLGTPAMVREELALFDFWLGGAEANRPVTGAEAVRAATLNAARAAGLDDRLGSIEPGKLADLVVIDGDPLDDPSLVGGHAATVFREGALVVDNIGLAEPSRTAVSSSGDAST